MSGQVALIYQTTVGLYKIYQLQTFIGRCHESNTHAIT